MSGGPRRSAETPSSAEPPSAEAPRVVRIGAVAVIAASLGLATVLAIGGRTGTATIASDPMTRAAAGDTRVGPSAADAVIAATLALHQPGEAAQLAHLQALAAGGVNAVPLSAAELGRRYGLPDRDLAAVTTWVEEHGLTVVASYPQRTNLRVSGTVAAMAAAFATSFEDRRTADGLRYHEPTKPPTLPAALRGLVDAVADLGDRPPPLQTRAILGGEARPTDLAAAYDIKPLYDAGITGAGTYVGIVSMCTHNASDIATYEGQYNLADPQRGNAVEDIPVADTKCTGDRQAGYIGEVSGDIEVVRGIAPGANILNFEAAYTSSQSDILDAIVKDGRARIVTDSWGDCWDQVSAADRAAGLKSLTAALDVGINVFVASGDWGAYDCHTDDAALHQLSVDWPSASDYTISVGGTALDVRTDGAYLSEAAWGDYLEVGGGGGGLVPGSTRPAWQVGAGVDNPFSDGGRQVPDVSASASMESPYAIYFTKPEKKGAWRKIGGTSMASPFWAGVMALVSEHANRARLALPKDFHTLLYGVAANSPTAFHDVTRGSNLYYPATPGWDFATGLGSPDVARFDAAVIAMLGSH